MTRLMCTAFLCAFVSGTAAAAAHLRCDFEDGESVGWSPGRAQVDGQQVGTLPSVRLARAPNEPTYGGSKSALLLDDPAGDSPEACATVRFPAVTITANTTVSLCYRWESESGKAGLDVRLPTTGTLKYWPLISGKSGEWQRVTAKVVDFRRGDVPARIGETFDAFTVRIHSTGKGWRRLRVDNLVIYEGPDTQPPLAVGELQAAQRGARTELTWPSGEDDTAVVSYSVHRGDRADFAPSAETLIGTTQASRFVDIFGAKGTAFYRVIATDFGGNDSPPSAVVPTTARLSPLQAPRATAPQDGHAQLVGEEAVLRWDGVPGAARYLVQYARDLRFVGSHIVEVAQPQLRLTALEPGTWRWRVMALDADGFGSEFSKGGSFSVKRYYETVKPAPHPRLYFQAEDIPKLRAATEVEPRKKFWRSVQQAADGWITQPPVQYVPAERWGTFLITTRSANARIETFTLAYLLTADERYLAKAKEQVKVVLSWDCWVDPCHGGGKSRADLATGEICRGLGTFYDWAYDALSQPERDDIRREVVRRGIVPIYERSVEGASWARSFSNWAAVVHGGAGVAALALLDEEPDAALWLDQIEAKMRCYLDTFDSQGGWVEGPGYWSYGVSYALWFIDALRRVTHGERDLYRHDRLARTLNFVLHCTTPDGRGSVNFADSPYGPAFNSALVRRLAAEYQNPYGAWHLSRSPGGGLWDFLWHEALPPGREPTAEDLPPAMLFHDIHWAVLRQGWTNPRDCFFALKGGTNNDWHGHRDMAHFILNAFGKRLLIDQGAGVYRTDYWKGEDYEVTSEGHNTLLVDGKGQERRAEHDARITGFFQSPSYDYLLCDASRAYGERLQRFHRHVLYLRPDTFVLFDDVAAPKPARIESLLHTLGSITRAGNVLRFEGEDVALVARVVQPAEFTHVISKGRTQRTELADQFVRFGPSEPSSRVQFLLALRPAMLRELPQGVAVWDDFENGKVGGWKPSRGSVDGKAVGAVPEIKVAASPAEPTYGGSMFALVLDDPVGDSPEACADLRFSPVTVTPNTRVTFACRWESESGKGNVNLRINAGGLLKYFSPAAVPAKQWVKVSARALDFRRGEIATYLGEQFDALTIRITSTEKGWRRLWIDDVAVYEGTSDELPLPRVAAIDPDKLLAAEPLGNERCVGLKLRRSGTPDEDYILFRREADINCGGVSTDASVCALAATPDGQVSRFFVHRATQLRWRETPLFRCAKPVSASFQLSAQRVTGVVESPEPTTVEVFSVAKPLRVLLNSKPAAFSLDPVVRLCRIALEKGRHTFEAELSR